MLIPWIQLQKRRDDAVSDVVSSVFCVSVGVKEQFRKY